MSKLDQAQVIEKIAEYISFFIWGGLPVLAIVYACYLIIKPYL